MPRGDGTGPYGQGPATGRGAGYCEGYPVPGYMNPAGGRGYRGGRGWGGRGQGRGWGGRGWGWRHRHGAMGPVDGPWGPPGWPPPVAPPYEPPYAPPYEPQMGKEYELNMLRQQVSALEGTLDRVRQRMRDLEDDEPSES